MANIHDKNEQLKDFLRSDDKNKNQTPINPYNIIWFLDNCVPENYDNQLRKTALSYIRNNHKLHISNQSMIAVMMNENNQNIRIVDLIENEKVDVSNIIMSVIKNKKYGLLKILCDNDYGFNVNYKNKDGNFGLRYSITKGQLKMFDILYEHKNIDKNITDNDGKNIAHYAFDYEKYKLIEKLWKDKKDLFILKTNEGKTIYDFMDSDYKNVSWPKKMYALFAEIHEYCKENNIEYQPKSKKFQEKIFLIENIVLNKRLKEELPINGSSKKVKL